MLVAEDEVLVLMVLADALEDEGFRVIAAANGDEALQALEAVERDGGHVDVLFTDVNMPGSLDGLGLARLVHERRPGIKLLIASGQVRLGEDQIPDRGRFLPKPYAPDDILREVRTLIAS